MKTGVSATEDTAEALRIDASGCPALPAGNGPYPAANQKSLPACEITDQQERLQALGKLATGIVHDLNNALMPIRNLTTHLLRKANRGEPAPKQIEMLNTILAATNNAQSIVKRLHEFYSPDEPCPASDAGPAGLPAEAVPPEAETSSLRLLVIDDDEGSLMVLRKCLAAEGHTTETFKSGEEGLARLAATSFDMVLTDRSMAGISGDVVAATVKKQYPHIPVILVTGYGDLILGRGHRIPGVDLVVPKPVSRELLRKAIGTVLQDRGIGLSIQAPSTTGGLPCA